MSQQHDREGYNNELSNFASDFNGFTDTAEVEGAGYTYTDLLTLESSDYNGPSEYGWDLSI